MFRRHERKRARARERAYNAKAARKRKAARSMRVRALMLRPRVVVFSIVFSIAVSPKHVMWQADAVSASHIRETCYDESVSLCAACSRRPGV